MATEKQDQSLGKAQHVNRIELEEDKNLSDNELKSLLTGCNTCRESTDACANDDYKKK